MNLGNEKLLLSLTAIGIPLVVFGSFIDMLISQVFTFKQFLGASLVEYILFSFGVWLGYNINKGDDN